MHALPIKFVEDKALNWEEIKSFLKITADHNQWTNFGPVSRILEDTIHRQLQLDSSLAVVACSNATVALHNLVELHQYKNKKNLKWAVSSFGFYCTRQGPLRDALVVDCDEKGLLNLNHLKTFEYDGFIVTNIFGLQPNLEIYRKFAKENGKILLCDSATAYHKIQHGANEVISFHHTKPWGFGEGGCTIVEKEDEELFRALLSFGIGFNEKGLGARSTNGKLSDIAASFILQRINAIDPIFETYQRQYERIASIAVKSGFKRFDHGLGHPSIPPHLPILAPKPIFEVQNEIAVLQKYYHPLDSAPLANDLYARMLNIPCHRDMEELSDEQLYHLFTIQLRSL